MKNRVLSFCLATLMIVSMCVSFTFAAETHEEMAIDTLSMSQDEYLQLIYPTKSRFFSADTTSDKIERICEGFLTIGSASARSSRYDASVMVLQSDAFSDEVSYRLSEYEYLNAVHEALGWEVYADSIEFSDFSVDIDGTSATASIVESYTYCLDSDFGSDECYRMREYYFSLEKGDNNNWFITSVTSNDPNEDTSYQAIDVENVVESVVEEFTSAKLSAAVAATEDEIIGKEESMVASSRATLYKWTYDTSAAVAYAQRWYNGVNPLFGQASDDCMNFCSQCVWAGLGGTSKTGFPALSSSYLGGKSYFNVWCRGENSTLYSNAYLNWIWDNCCGFAKMMKVSSTITEGPFGNTHYGNLKYAAVGSVIYYSKNSNTPTETNLSHAMFVTKVTGTVGSRTNSNLWIAAHNSNTSSAYMPLLDYSSYSTSRYSTSVISCGYYTSRQP